MSVRSICISGLQIVKLIANKICLKDKICMHRKNANVQKEMHMRLKNVKIRYLLILLPLAVCLCAGLLIFARSYNGDPADAGYSAGDIAGASDSAGSRAVLTDDDDGHNNGTDPSAAETGVIVNSTGFSANDAASYMSATTASSNETHEAGSAEDTVFGTDLFANGSGGSEAGIDSFQPVSIGGLPYFIRINSNLAEIYDRQYKKSYEYKIGDDGTVVKSACISDLDGDGTDEILLITGTDAGEYGTHLMILAMILAPKADGTGGQPDGGRSSEPEADVISVEKLYKCDMTDINPWKVQTCDVDGDGKTEISVGVYKTARFHPVMAKRPFIYEWHGNAISPKWLGSRLSRPFDDYIFADINADGMDEIVSIEHLMDGRKAVNSYAWKGFGFEGIGESTGFDEILSIEKDVPEDGGAETIKALVAEEGYKKHIILRHNVDRLEHCYIDTVD